MSIRRCISTSFCFPLQKLLTLCKQPERQHFIIYLLWDFVMMFIFIPCFTQSNYYLLESFTLHLALSRLSPLEWVYMHRKTLDSLHTRELLNWFVKCLPKTLRLFSKLGGEVIDYCRVKGDFLPPTAAYTDTSHWL